MRRRGWTRSDVRCTATGDWTIDNALSLMCNLAEAHSLVTVKVVLAVKVITAVEIISPIQNQLQDPFEPKKIISITRII